MALVSLLVWAGAALFLIGALAKIVRYARMPLHVRWELYPVPKEAHRSKYGGSFLEELDWWTKEIPESKLSELKAMGEEIVLLKGVYEHNRPLWIWSWPFHLGLYFLVAAAVLLCGGGLLERALDAPLAEGAPVWRFAHNLTWLCLWAGLVLAIAGTLGLLLKRVTDPKLKGFTSPGAKLNLVFLLAALGAGLAARLAGDPQAGSLRAAYGAVFTFQGFAGAGGAPPLVALELALGAIFAAYLPFTFMSHMYMKFFTYHKVRWDDHPRSPGDPTDPRLLEALQYPVSWSAPHIAGDGKKTWAQVVTEEGTKK